jgi:hypothetical protein
VLVTCLIAAAPASSVPEEIVARSFRVVGKNGQNSAILAATDDGYVGLFFRDTKDKIRFMTLTTPAGDTTTSYSDGKTNRLEIGAIADGDARDYSLRLLAADRSAAWKPPVRNQVAAAPAR